MPTGQRCEQNDFATSALIATTPSRIASPAGCTGWTPSPASHSRADISAEIGRNPSTPGGRDAHGARPFMTANAQAANRTPVATAQASATACAARRAAATGEGCSLAIATPSPP